MKCKKDCQAEGCLACAKIEARIQRTVDVAPALTDEQIARLRRLLSPPTYSPPRDPIDAPVSLSIEVKR